MHCFDGVSGADFWEWWCLGAVTDGNDDSVSDADAMKKEIPIEESAEENQVQTSAIGTFLYWITSGVLAFVHPLISLKIGTWTFVIYACFSVVAAIFSFFSILDSQRLTQVEIVQAYSNIYEETDRGHSLIDIILFDIRNVNNKIKKMEIDGQKK